MTTEYKRGYHDCIRATRVVLRRIAQKRIPVRSTALIESIRHVLHKDTVEYNKGVSEALLYVQELLGPEFLPLYPGDIHEILQRLV
jgi:hypothetical protein